MEPETLKEANYMGIGVSIFLIAVGAILAWAVSVDTNGIDLNMVGVILMIVGILCLLLSLIFWSTWGGFGGWRRETVYREGSDVVADDGQGHSFRAPLGRARAVRIVPLTGGQPHGGTLGGYQVAIATADGDAAIAKPLQDWRAAHDLAQQLCGATNLPFDELTQSLFSRAGSMTPRAEA